MNYINQSVVDLLNQEYPEGTRVELIEMNDLYAPPMGTHGTVKYVDGIGTIHVQWDTGSNLGLVYGEDKYKKIIM